jgi:SAM-dependent methyltransferase
MRLVFLIASLFLTAPATAAAQPGLQEVCGDFHAWYETHASSEVPAAGYRAELIARGLALEEVERRLAILVESASACPAAAGAAFDRIYRNPTPRFNTAPNELLAETVKDMKPGRALDVAMGQGRNTLFLAKQGWDVTGFDVSAEGLSIARAAAETARVKIHAVQQGWQEFDLGKEQWDLIVLTYAWVPIDDPAFVQRLCGALRPGGYVVFEHLLRESRTGLGMPASQQLLRIFDGLRILRYEEVEQASDWNNEESPMVRFVARK